LLGIRARGSARLMRRIGLMATEKSTSRIDTGSSLNPSRKADRFQAKTYRSTAHS
jgi:hypothetical protein